MVPVKTFGDFVVCFEAEPEDITARHHFIKECGWTPTQFRKIAHFPFFSAKVSVFRDGEELACDYLGCCSYKTEAEFYTRYVGDYFADMVSECANEIKTPELSAAVGAWLLEVRA